MVRNSFMDGASGRGARPLPASDAPVQGAGRAPCKLSLGYVHKFSCRVSDEDWQLIRRIKFEREVDSTELLHAMLAACTDENGNLTIEV